MHNLLKFIDLEQKIDLGDIFTLLGAIFTLFSVLAILRQVRAANLNNALVNMDLIRNEEIKIRKKIHKSKKSLKQLTTILGKKQKLSQQDFFNIYSKKEYKYIRQIGYFYEYLGIIVRKKAIKLSLIFSLFSFPDEFWEQAESFRSIVIHKVGISDFWENFWYLQKRYKKRRSWKRVWARLKFFCRKTN